MGEAVGGVRQEYTVVTLRSFTLGLDAQGLLWVPLLWIHRGYSGSLYSGYTGVTLGYSFVDFSEARN